MQQRILTTLGLGLVAFGSHAENDDTVAVRLDEGEFRRAEEYALTGPAEWCKKHCVPGGDWGKGCSACQNGYNHEPPMINPGQTIGCPLPALKNGRFVCPDENLSLEQRRTLFDNMKPWNQINGETLDDNWPATAGQTEPMSSSPDTAKWNVHYGGVLYTAYTLSRVAGERAPIHYHEVPQQICLAKGKVLVKLEGSADKIYTAPDCYLMPAYTKMSVISLEDKVENCMFRVPDGGLDWVVIEPNYYGLQGQWANFKTTKHEKLGMGYHQHSEFCQPAQCAVANTNGGFSCVEEGWVVHSSQTWPYPTNCGRRASVRCSMVAPSRASWQCHL